MVLSECLSFAFQNTCAPFCFNTFIFAVNEPLFSVAVVNVHVHCQCTYVNLNAYDGNKLIFCTHAFFFLMNLSSLSGVSATIQLIFLEQSIVLQALLESYNLEELLRVV